VRKITLGICFVLSFVVNDVFAASCEDTSATVDERLSSIVKGPLNIVKAVSLESACLVYSDEGRAIRTECRGEAIQRTRFKPKKIWHSNFTLGHTFVVINDVDLQNCGLIFEENKEYVLYIGGDGGESILKVDTRLGTKLLSETPIEEIEWLEKHSIDTEVERKKQCQRTFKHDLKKLTYCLNYYEDKVGFAS
jgi:hypothetical protein